MKSLAQATAFLGVASFCLSASAQIVSPPPTPSISSIAFVYHGAAVDDQLRVIRLDRATIESIHRSLLGILGSPRPVANLDGSIGQAPELISQSLARSSLQPFASSPEATLVATQSLIEKGVARLPRNERDHYSSRVKLLRDRINELPEIRASNASTAVTLMKSAKDLTLELPDQKPLGTKSYIEECASNSVPIPPDWPNASWKDQGELKITFASFPNAVKTEVFTYEAPKNQGLCYALPRLNADGGYEAVGIICQSRDTGKACFWDNIDAASGDRIVGKNISFEIAKIENGFNLQENCTACHRGGNVFMVHPTTPLGSVSGRNPKVRYSPIGQPTWSNPPPMAELSDGACSSCHEIAAADAAYCGFLKKAADLTMPSPASPSGWDNPSTEYKAHIDFLKSKCAVSPATMTTQVK